MKLCLLSILTLCFLSTFGQVIDIDKEDLKKMEFAGVFKSSIGLQIGGTSGIIGFSYDLLLTEKLRAEIGGGYAGAGIGIKIYPFSVKRQAICFNLGIRSQVLALPDSSPMHLHSLPIGITYFGSNRLNYEFDLGPALPFPLHNNENIYGASEFLFGYASFKLSYRFSFYNMNRVKELERN
jgi:hypothetical protein